MFLDPAKPIGRFYTWEAVPQIQSRSPDQVFKEDAGRGWRQGAPPPQPVEIVALDAVKCMVEYGFITIAVGDGRHPRGAGRGRAGRDGAPSSPPWKKRSGW